MTSSRQPGERAAGGTAKAQKLNERFPNSPTDFSLLYLGTTWLPRDLGPLLRIAKRRGAAIVVNQDGVAYPGWAGERTDELNAPLRRAVLAADHVVYQSEFSKQSADEFLGAPGGTWEILHNAADTTHFTPPPAPPDGGPVLLLGGDQTQAYRLELALRTLAALRADRPDARLADNRTARQPDRPAARSSSVFGESVHLRRRVCAARRPERVPEGASAAPHEGAGPVPHARRRGDGLRLAGRASGERWNERARRRRRRHRRPASGFVGARRAAVTRRARRGRGDASSTTSPATPPRRARGRSSASRSSRGSSVTRRSSSASLRSSRAGGRGASRADSAHPIRRDGRATREHLPPV